jgi:DNA-binding NtrC family response regulator
MKKIYVVDDDQSIRDALRAVLEDEEFLVNDYESGNLMLQALQSERPDLILLDVWMGKEDGLDLLDKIIEAYPMLPVLMISGHGTIEQAVTATKKGAVDFLEKPLSLDNVLARISQILNIDSRQRLKEERVELTFDNIIGLSPGIMEVKKSISRAAGTNARVFIFGENGTGKELAARAIYQNSKRSDRPFIEVNCAAIPEELIESELFGHERGSFTGAHERKPGKFELADEGTLFLDEICDMSLSTQARVLRALQEQRFSRVGGTENISVDVRVIAATNIDPEEAIRQGKFREDLYYRLNVIPIVMPPLRDRRGDIPLLIEYFIREIAKENLIPARKFTPAALDLLINYNWPGNVRELRNVIERLSILASGDEIDADSVSQNLKEIRQKKERGESASGLAGDLKSAREEFERNYIIQALRQNDMNISRAARYLGMERTNLHRKLKALNIDPDKL